jgi:hypothetical protein
LVKEARGIYEFTQSEGIEREEKTQEQNPNRQKHPETGREKKKSKTDKKNPRMWHVRSEEKGELQGER